MGDKNFGISCHINNNIFKISNLWANCINVFEPNGLLKVIFPENTIEVCSKRFAAVYLKIE